MVGIVSGIKNPKISWKIEPSINDYFRSFDSYISIPKLSLKSNVVYKISLNIKENYLSAFEIISTPAKPSCVTPTTKFLGTYWYISEIYCSTGNSILTISMIVKTDKNFL